MLEINELRPSFYAIEHGGVRSYMIIGKDRVLLIDTGFGGSDLKDQVASMSNLPIEVLYTHSDGDHIGDASVFDVPMIHPAEMDYFKSKSPKDITLKPIWEGDTIEIGDYKFEIILIPGHTPGSIALFEANHRFMLTGDTVQYGPVYMFGPGRNLQAYLASLKKLQAIADKVDYFYACHHELLAPPELLAELIAGVEAILDGTVEGETVDVHGNAVKLCKYGRVAFYV